MLLPAARGQRRDRLDTVILQHRPSEDDPAQKAYFTSPFAGKSKERIVTRFEEHVHA